MNIKELIDELAEDWTGYRDALKTALYTNNELLTQINNYLRDNAGKQLRPILALLAANSCGIINQKSYNCAAVCEMLHTATLLHDDVADNGDLRRGVPTIKAKFTPAASVLSGDFWLARALAVLTESCTTEILMCYTNTVGELAEGELFQMQKAISADTSEEDYYSIIHKKTASLFMATMESAAISVNASEFQISLIRNFAYHLGIAFQIQDDILDYSPNLHTGKSFGADIKEKKITLPLLGAMANSSKYEADKIREMLLKCNEEESLVKYIFDYVERYKGLEYAKAKLYAHSKQAKDCIEELKKLTYPNKKNMISLDRLEQLALYVGRREQ